MDPIPPDPYAALNVPRDASAAVIKTAYRKLALKCHPDKAKDKGDEFHRIQQAYELIGEDESRRQYDDQVRLNDLRKDVYARRGSGYSPNVEVRTAAFDVRGSPGTGASFQARGPARYEERRPNAANMGSGPAPRSPYAEDEVTDSYFPTRSGSRKYDGYDSSSRRPASSKATPPKSAPRSQETRDAMRQDKLSSSKIRNEKKKQRDQEMGRERMGKHATSYASVESDGSDEGYSDPSRSRSSPHGQERMRKENREEFLDPRIEKAQNMSSNAKYYMTRAKAEGGPFENEVPPQHVRSSSAQEIPLRPRPAPQQEPQFEVRRSGRGDSRPSMVRSRPKDKATESPRASSKTAAKETRSKTADRSSPEPLHMTSERRPPPKLQTTNSSPASIKIPKTKSRTMDESDSRGGPIPLARSSTAPTVSPPPPPLLQRSSTRKGSTAPIVSSGLRNTEINDSGYSTSNSPSETPQPPLAPSTKIYHYGADSVHVDTSGNEYEPVIREPGRPMRRSPSPMHETLPREAAPRDRERHRMSLPRDREREWAPPAVRSASYQTANAARNSPDLDRQPPSSGRRPSMPQRTSSKRGGGSGRSPMATPPLRTGGNPNSKDGYFFGEIPSDSPIEFREPNYARRTFDMDDVRYTKRASSGDVNYGSYSHGPSTGYYSGGGGVRRGSDDLTKARAEAYMESNNRERAGPGPGGLKRGATFAY